MWRRVPRGCQERHGTDGLLLRTRLHEGGGPLYSLTVSSLGVASLSHPHPHPPPDESLSRTLALSIRTSSS